MVILEEIKFCSQCGIRFSDYTTQIPKHCPNCRILINYSNPHKEDKQCSICHHKVRNKDLIKCSYCERVFHYKCISDWLITRNLCPVCLNKYILPENAYK